jgi:hypothetical protein
MPHYAYRSSRGIKVRIFVQSHFWNKLLSKGWKKCKKCPQNKRSE